MSILYWLKVVKFQVPIYSYSFIIFELNNTKSQIDLLVGNKLKNETFFL